MEDFLHIFGPVPSRRLGNSLGISPIPPKTCNYSCVYCQLGRTRHMMTQRQEFYPLAEILEEFDRCLAKSAQFDVITIVGEGEPTLYLKLGELVSQIKQRTFKPVAVITNGALLSDPSVRQDLMECDIVLPSLDAWDKETFQKMDRPHGNLDFDQITQGLITFSNAYAGQLWLEIMLCGGLNDDPRSIDGFTNLLSKIRYDRLYLNTPVRPPAEANVEKASSQALHYAVEKLGGIAIDMLTTGSFSSEIADNYSAILSIIARHPMNQFEITSFLQSRQAGDTEELLTRLQNDPTVECIAYKGIFTYRPK